MGFNYSRTLTIDHTKCGSASSSSFPVMVSATDSTLKSVANGGHVTNSNGSDILFFSDAAGTTQLPSEIDFYDPVNGVLVTWIQLSVVSNIVDTLFYLFYGNSSAPVRTTNPWDANFALVMHLSNGTVLTASDSTTNNATVIVNGSVPAGVGQIDGAAVYSNNTANYLDVANPIGGPFRTLGQSFTLEAWVNTSDISNRRTIFSWNDQAGTVELELNTTPNVNALVNGVFVATTSAAPITVGSWAHVVYVKNGAGATSTVYVNGVSQALSVNVSQTYTNPTNDLWIGKRATASQPWSGRLDELRISTSVRSVDWILTSFNNQNAPGNIGSPNFLTWGSETMISSGANIINLMGIKMGMSIS